MTQSIHAPILVTGANGQVGHELVQRAGNMNIHGLDRSELDITDAAAVNAKVQALQPALIINAAAYTAVDKAESEREQAFAVNSTGAANLAHSAQQAGIPLLHISTDYVFDGSKPSPYRENDQPNPLGVYGESKLAGEQAIRASLSQHIILRVSWVFGAHGNNFVKTMLRLAQDRDALSIVADQNGAPTYAGHIADALLGLSRRYLSGDSLAWGTWHYAGTPVTSWYDFAAKIFELGLGQGLISKAPTLTAITTKDYPTPAQRPKNSAMDLMAMHETLNLPIESWEDGLTEMLHTLRNQR